MYEALIKMLRVALADNEEPYIYDNRELEAVLEVAAYAYSKYRPMKKKGILNVIPQVSEYPLPEGFQTWTEGFESYTVYEKAIDLGFKPIRSYDIAYVYLADRKPEEVPAADLPLIIDYAFYYVIQAAVREESEISGLRLGKGLQIQFGNASELSNAAERRLLSFNERLTASLGGWV